MTTRRTFLGAITAIALAPFSFLRRRRDPTPGFTPKAKGTVFSIQIPSPEAEIDVLVHNGAIVSASVMGRPMTIHRTKDRVTVTANFAGPTFSDDGELTHVTIELREIEPKRQAKDDCPHCKGRGDVWSGIGGMTCRCVILAERLEIESIVAIQPATEMVFLDDLPSRMFGGRVG